MVKELNVKKILSTILFVFILSGIANADILKKGANLSSVLDNGNSASDTILIDDLETADDVLVGDDLFLTQSGRFNFNHPTNTLYMSNIAGDTLIDVVGGMRWNNGSAAGTPEITVVKGTNGNAVSITKNGGTGDAIAATTNMSGSKAISGLSSNSGGYGLYGANNAGWRSLVLLTSGGSGLMFLAESKQTSGDLINISAYDTGTNLNLVFDLEHDGKLGLGYDVAVSPNHAVTASGTVSGALWVADNDGAAGPKSTWYHKSVSSTTNDIVGELEFTANDDGGTETIVGRILMVWDDAVDGQEAGAIVFQVANGGDASTAALVIKGNNNRATSTQLITMNYPMQIQDVGIATPTCVATLAGTLYFNSGPGNDKDLCSLCAKANGGAYDWREINIGL